MKFLSLSTCSLIAFIAVGCSDTSIEPGFDAVKDVAAAVQDTAQPDLEYDNLFDANAFEKRNVRFLNASSERYADADAVKYVYLNASAYASESQSILRVCADMKSYGANPALSIRGADSSVTATLIENDTQVSMRKAGGGGASELSDGRLCVMSAVKPAGTKLNVLIFPAMSTDTPKHEKAAVGELDIKNITVSWIPA